MKRNETKTGGRTNAQTRWTKKEKDRKLRLQQNKTKQDKTKERRQNKRKMTKAKGKKNIKAEAEHHI